MDWDAYTNRLFQIESGGNPNAVTGSNRGLGQFSPDLEAQYGITDANRSDPNAQAAAVRQNAMANMPGLTKALGREPTPAEMYIAHQQGIAGGPALLTAEPNQAAWQAIRPFYKNDSIAQQAITGNIPRGHELYGRDPNNITAADFTNLWKTKFGGAPSPTQVAAAPMAGSPVDAAPPTDIRPLTPPAPLAGPPTAGESINNALGMIDPNKLATTAGKFGPGMGMLNSPKQVNPEVAAMMQPTRINGGTPMSQMLRQQLLASILKR